MLKYTFSQELTFDFNKARIFVAKGRILYFLPGQRLRVYRNFKAIEADDFHGIVRYFERNEEAIDTLDLEEYMDCTIAYTNALYETGDYGKAIVMCNHLLELTIEHNISNWGGEDLFEKMLLKKAMAQYRLEEDKKAVYTLSELIKIYPQNRFARALLRMTLLRQKPAWLTTFRAVAVFLLFLAAVVIAFEIFGAALFPDLYPLLNLTHQGLIIGGVLFLCFGELRHYYQALRFIRRLKR